MDFKFNRQVDMHLGERKLLNKRGLPIYFETPRVNIHRNASMTPKGRASLVK